MKIAHLISNFPLPFVGGAEACVHNLAMAQTKKGHTVKVITPIKKRLPELDYEVLPLKPKYASIATVIRPYFIRQLYRYQKMYKFDIWQVTIGNIFGIAAADFFRKENIPCVLRCSGRDIQIEPGIGYGARLNRRLNSSIKRNYPKYDALISIVSGITKEYLNIGVPKEKICFISNGTNKEIFDIEVDKEAVKKEAGAGNGRKLILTVGRNDPKKGFGLIPAIIESLLKKRRDFLWFLIGNGNDIVEKEARKRGLGEFITTREIRSEAGNNTKPVFPGRELVRIYKSADLFALPTLIEGCSNVIIEAMSAGIPVVTTDAQGVRDMIEHEKTGLISSRSRVDAMADNIDRALEDEGLRRTLIAGGLEQTKESDWSVVSDIYIGLYRSVIRRKRGQGIG